MTKKKEAGATPRRYDETFKQEAVRLWRSSGRAAEHTARELGISVFNLYEWGREGRPSREQGRVGGGERAAEARAGENHRAEGHPKKSRGHPLRTAAERYARIKTMSDEHSIKQLCGALGVSRSGYYQWRHAGASARARSNEAITGKIKAVHAASRCTYGSPRVSAALRAQGERVGRNRVARLMREAGLEGRQRRRYRVRTTDSRHDEPIAPNRLADASPPAKPDEVWVADITYVETAEGWLYLAGVLDLYSRRLIGWAMGPSLDTSLPLAAPRMALRQRRPAPGVPHHSDRGCQYASASYRRTLADHGCTASMSRRANCYDNATMEAFWSTLKQELIYRRRFITRSQATTAIFDYIEGFYNRSRLHSALGFTSPLDYESNLN